MRSTFLRGTILAASLALGSIPVAVAAEELHWYRGNTHTHTVNSDGDTSPDAVARWYKEHRYDFLFITDHEYVTDVEPLNAILAAQERFLILPGQEITQWGKDPARSAAHVNALFTREVIWPVGERTCIGSGCGAKADASVPLADTFQANIAAVLAQGGIAQVNHPNYRWAVKPEDLADIPDGILLEVWNGLGLNEYGGDDGDGNPRPSSEGFWDYLLGLGKVVWGVGADDSHTEEGRGKAWIVVRAPELSADAIRQALAAGDFYASTGVALSDVQSDAAGLSIAIREQRDGARFTTRFIGQGGEVLAEVAGRAPRYEFTGEETYVRASIMDSNGKRAWTQPVFLDGRDKKRKHANAQSR